MNRTLYKVGLAPRHEAEWIHRDLRQIIGVEPPFDVKAIAEHFGLAVDAFPFVSINGCLVDLGPALGHAIGVNRRHGRARRRWTVAHELYHYLAHRWHLSVLVCSNDSPPEMLALEDEANAFAAELLMPPAWVSSWWSRTGHVARCAEPFGVSVTAMRFRLEELRLVRRR